ncbi:hypothetical protein L7F22_024647 [Adiantum nelumboides]|nr:hypothetical protein [Adiantum nelumboides]
MDFIFDLPRAPTGNDGIWTIICRFSKQAHFVPVRKKIKSEHMVKMFMHNVFKYHGMPQSIVSDRDPRMTSLFWKALFENMGTTKFSSSFHPQTNGQSEDANSTVLDLLKCYVSEHKATWKHYLPLVEYAYNNTVHTSTGKAPFEIVEGARKSHPFRILRTRYLRQTKDMVPEEQPEVEELDEILVPEQILAHKDRKFRSKVSRRYLVKFKNYSPMDAKWMEEAELVLCLLAALYTQFLQSRGSMPFGSLVRGLRASVCTFLTVIEGELWRRMCLKAFPEVGNKFKCLIGGARGDNQHQSELKSSTYYLLLQRLLSPPLQRTCIAEPLHASSTDNLPQESVAQTLYPESEYPVEAHSYWSSVGEANASMPETLTYRLVSDLCVVHDVKIKPFLASFQLGNPIYSSQMVRFRFGYARSPKPRWSGLFQCIKQRPNKATTDDYVWTYESPAFPMAQESTLQTFRLPNRTLCIGGILQVELMGRVQTQATDRLYYICVSHVYVSGQPILDFKLDSIDSAGQVMLRQVSEKDKSSLSKRTHISLDAAIEKNDGASIIEHLKADRSELRSGSIVDRLLLYLLDAKLLNDLEDE